MNTTRAERQAAMALNHQLAVEVGVPRVIASCCAWRISGGIVGRPDDSTTTRSRAEVALHAPDAMNFAPDYREHVAEAHTTNHAWMDDLPPQEVLVQLDPARARITARLIRDGSGEWLTRADHEAGAEFRHNGRTYVILSRHNFANGALWDHEFDVRLLTL